MAAAMPTDRASPAHFRVWIFAFQERLTDMLKLRRIKNTALRALLQPIRIESAQDQLLSDVVPTGKLAISLDVKAMTHETSIHGFREELMNSLPADPRKAK